MSKGRQRRLTDVSNSCFPGSAVSFVLIQVKMRILLSVSSILLWYCIGEFDQNQDILSLLIIFFILMTCMFDKAMIL